ncbi:MAG: phosphohydrolase [Clostridiales bacterium]|nr:phosphohydrolase [Clostridiales bacterium]
MDKLTSLKKAMIDYYTGDAKRICHFIKVHGFASVIERLENLDEKTQFIIESASLVHDIGIKPAEEKYGDCSGKLQEKEDYAPAYEMLSSLGYDKTDTDRICYLVAHHHTYDGIDSPDYQILVEADFIVNLFEDKASPAAIKKAYETIFKTKSGKEMCKTVFDVFAD